MLFSQNPNEICVSSDIPPLSRLTGSAKSAILAPISRLILLTFALVAFGSTAFATGAASINLGVSSDTILQGDTTTLSIYFYNADSQNALSGMAATIALPSNLVIAATPNVSDGCSFSSITANAGTSSIVLTGGSLGTANAQGTPAQCVISLTVTSTVPSTYTITVPANGPTLASPNTFTPGGAKPGFSAQNNGATVTNSTPTSQSIVVTALSSLTASWSAPSSFYYGETGAASLTITNPNAVAVPLTSSTISLTSVALAASPNASMSCSGGSNGTVSATGGASSLGFSDGSIAANGTCVVTFSLESPATSQSGMKASITTVGNSRGLALGGSPVSTTFSNANPLAITKTPGSAVTIRLSQATTVTITLQNKSQQQLMNVTSYTETLPTNLVVDTSITPTVSCTGTGAVNGTLTATNGASSVVLAGATIAAATSSSSYGQCVITVGVSSGTAGTYATASATASPATAITNAGISPALLPVSANTGSNIVVYGGLTVVKADKNSGKAYQGQINAAYTITISNYSAGAATGVTFTDDLPAGSTSGAQMVLSATGVTFGTGCSGFTVTGGAGASSVTVSGGTVVGGTGTAPGTCVVTINVTMPATATVGENYNNVLSVGAVSGHDPSNTVINNNTAANDIVVATPSLTVKQAIPTSNGLGSGSGGKALVQGSDTTLTITITNPTPSALSGLAFSEALDSHVTIAANPAITTSSGCGNAGTITAAPGASSISATGLAVPASNGTCVITLAITSNSPSTAASPAYWVNTINAGAISDTQGVSNASSAAFNLYVTQGLAATASFTPSTVYVGGRSTLTLTVTNNTSAAVTGLSLTPTAFSKYTVAATPNASTTCANATLTATAGAGSIGLSGASLAAGASCQINVDVVTTSGTSNWSFTLPTSGVTNDQSIALGANATATLTYATGNLTVAKTFSAASAESGTPVTLNISVQAPVGVPVTQLSLTDSLPSGMSVYTTPNITTTCTGATITAVARGTSVAISGVSLAAGASCQFTADVTSVQSLNLTNTIPANSLSTREGLTNALPVSATLSTLPAINVLMNFSPTAIVAGGTSTLDITLVNSYTATDLTGVAFTNLLPSNLVIAGTPNLTSNCGGSVTATGGTNSIALTGGALTHSTTCDITLQVTSSTNNTYTNTIPSGGVTTSQSISNANPASAVLNVLTPPTAAIAFSPTSIIAGATSTMTITLGNTNASSLTGLAIANTLPSGVFLAASPAPSTSCGGTVSALGGGSSLALTGGTLAGNATCTITVKVTSNTPNSYTDTIPVSAIGDTQGLSNTATSAATLTVYQYPTVAQAFLPTSIAPNGQSTFTVTLGNSNTGPITLSSPFTINLPGAILIANPNGLSTTCTGTITATPGSSVITFASSGSSIKVGGCQISVTVTGVTPGTYTNTISASSLVTSAGNNQTITTADLTVTPLATASLATSKTLYSVVRGGNPLASLAGYQAQSGDVITYQLSVANSSASASGVTTLTETAPANTSYSGIIGTSLPEDQGWTLTGSTYTQDLTVAASSSASAYFTVTVGTLSDGVTAIANTVSSSSGSCASCTVSSATAPRLAISKTPPATLAAGGQGSWSVTLANHGGSATSGTVAFTDTLPSGLTFASQTAGAPGLACTASGQIITCTGTPNLAAGASTTISYTTNASVSASGTMVNAALLTSLGGDPRIPANDAGTPGAGSSTQGSDKLSAKAAVSTATASLATTKTLYSVVRGGNPLASLAGYQAQSGDVITYQLSVANSSASASGVTTLTETAPANTSYSGIIGTSLPEDQGWTLTGSTYTQDLTVAASSSASAYFTVTVGTLSDGVTAIANTVSSSSGSCASCTVSSATAPRLAISKTPPATLAAGGQGSWSVTLANHGGSATSGTVAFTDTLPSGLTFASQTAGAPGLACTASGQIITCTGTPNLAAGASTTISYTTNASVSASGTMVNAALLTSLGGDPRIPANDAGTPGAGSSTQGSDKLSAKAAVSTATASLATSKVLASINGDPSGTLVKSGATLVYSISVKETSGTAAGATTLTETLPANTSYTGSGEGWTVNGSQYTQIVTVAAGQTVSKTFTVQAGTLASSVASIVNTVTTSSGTCPNCTVTTPTVQPSQTRTNTTPTNTPYTPAPVPGCTATGLQLLAPPANGTVTFGANGSILYTPNAGYIGPDSYSYAMQCGAGVQVSIAAQVLVIDPSGVIYDSVTRQPISGATVTLIGPSGSTLSNAYLDTTLGGPAVQVTGADGRYAYYIKSTAPSGTYQFRVAAPAGYQNAPSAMIPPKGALFTPPFGGQVFYMQVQDGAPSLAQDVTYYLNFAFQFGGANLAQISDGVAHNHIPLDPAHGPLPLVVTKAAGKTSVSTGDLVPYEITVRVQDGIARGLANVVDLLPPGFSYVKGSAVVNGVRTEPVITSSSLTWPNQIIPASGAVTYDLVLSVGAGVSQGTRTNVALVNGVNGLPISNRAEAAVTIAADSLFDCTDVIGKVYDDRNNNGQQDIGEPGLANIRLATVNGLLVKTDAYGRYHITCAAVPNGMIGSNFILKLDPSSLPAGYVVTTSNPASARLTPAVMAKINFGVAQHGVVIALSADDFGPDNRLTPAAADRVAQTARDAVSHHQSLRLLYRASDEAQALVSARLDLAERAIHASAPASGGIDRDSIRTSGRARP